MSGCQKDYLLPTPNQFSKDETVFKPRTPTIKIEDVKKWFDEQTALGFAANNGEDSSLFHAMPKWELANNAFNKIGAEYVSVPLGLDLNGGIIVPRLLVRRSSNGSFIGRYVLYLPTDEYHNRLQGQYNPSNFTGSVVYTDFKGNYSHGYKIENGEWVGTAVAKKDDERGGVPSGLRSCTWTTYCTNIQVSPNQGAPMYLECFSIVTCTSLCGPAVSNCYLEQDPWGTDEYGGGTGGDSGGGHGSWSSSQPTFYLGQLTDQARDFLVIKGFSQSEIDFLSFSPAIVNQIFSSLSTDESVDALRFCYLHVNTCIENSDYRLANVQLQPELGSDAWINTLRFDNEPPNSQEIALALNYKIESIKVYRNSLKARDETILRFGHNGGDDISDAFRHSYWNALNTKDIPLIIAKQFADAHESAVNTNNPNELLSQSMDFWNNEQGRIIGINNPIASDAYLSDLVYQAITNGLMKYICRGILIFTNQICQ